MELPIQVDFIKLYNELNEAGRLHKENKKVSLKASNPIRISTVRYHTKFLAAIPMNRIIDFTTKPPEGNVKAADGSRIDSMQLAALIRIQARHSVSNWMSYSSSDPDYPSYSAAVPLVLMAHKKHNGVQYEEWRNLPGLHYIINPYLRDALFTKDESGNFCLRQEFPNYNPHVLLSMRSDCLVWGGKAGKVTAWNIRKGGIDREFDALAHQLRRMLLQTWMFSAEKRNKYMIADPTNWDELPELLEEQILKVEQPEQTLSLGNDIDWEEDWL